jgi:hypothetical protein
VLLEAPAGRDVAMEVGLVRAFRVARADARAPRAGVVSSISRSHSPCQEGAVRTDPSMSDISYIET